LAIERLQLEMDSGRVVRHGIFSNFIDWFQCFGWFIGGREMVDLNRSGVPLVEVVTAPDLHSPSEVVSFVEQLRLLLAHNGVTGGDMHS
jgi:aspartyl-tRNA(Asn)/glutamyl-tRNA(Gln) amidotransferase subunit B